MGGILPDDGNFSEKAHSYIFLCLLLFPFLCISWIANAPIDVTNIFGQQTFQWQFCTFIFQTQNFSWEQQGHRLIFVVALTHGTPTVVYHAFFGVSWGNTHFFEKSHLQRKMLDFGISAGISKKISNVGDEISKNHDSYFLLIPLNIVSHTQKMTCKPYFQQTKPGGR